MNYKQHKGVKQYRQQDVQQDSKCRVEQDTQIRTQDQVEQDIYIIHHHHHHCTREEVKGAGAVQLGFGLLTFCDSSSSHFCSHFCSCGVPFKVQKCYGIPFVVQMSVRKSADLWIFGKKGNDVARPHTSGIST